MHMKQQFVDRAESIRAGIVPVSRCVAASCPASIIQRLAHTKILSAYLVHGIQLISSKVVISV